MQDALLTIDAQHYSVGHNEGAELPDVRLEPIAQVTRGRVAYTVFRSDGGHLVIQAAKLHGSLLSADGESLATVTDLLVFGLPDLADAAQTIFASRCCKKCEVRKKGRAAVADADTTLSGVEGSCFE